jgi:hypothetical protein
MASSYNNIKSKNCGTLRAGKLRNQEWSFTHKQKVSTCNLDATLLGVFATSVPFTINCMTNLTCQYSASLQTRVKLLTGCQHKRLETFPSNHGQHWDPVFAIFLSVQIPDGRLDNKMCGP